MGANNRSKYRVIGVGPAHSARPPAAGVGVVGAHQGPRAAAVARALPITTSPGPGGGGGGLVLRRWARGLRRIRRRAEVAAMLCVPESSAISDQYHGAGADWRIFQNFGAQQFWNLCLYQKKSSISLLARFITRCRCSNKQINSNQVGQFRNENLLDRIAGLECSGVGHLVKKHLRNGRMTQHLFGCGVV